ncbi:hypothetical protein H696_02025 [Fonticula alba]|uniref:Uncharacterized protein n=1 Tax=Fonticula alba TaxID=691883 RepID=A0A058ZA15_FONAL|nr:hypothetical protein H696_02025 [Fonticula alba]KCV71075.1 hypothetical protein H696_02025 [Fonticula alba]|eukprot:XP_009494198.1 hypothetical protein H696_02025 [Fonticula alba]
MGVTQSTLPASASEADPQVATTSPRVGQTSVPPINNPPSSPSPAAIRPPVVATAPTAPSPAASASPPDTADTSASSAAGLPRDHSDLDADTPPASPAPWHQAAPTSGAAAPATPSPAAPPAPGSPGCSSSSSSSGLGLGIVSPFAPRSPTLLADLRIPFPAYSRLGASPLLASLGITPPRQIAAPAGTLPGPSPHPAPASAQSVAGGTPASLAIPPPADARRALPPASPVTGIVPLPEPAPLAPTAEPSPLLTSSLSSLALHPGPPGAASSTDAALPPGPSPLIRHCSVHCRHAAGPASSPSPDSLPSAEGPSCIALSMARRRPARSRRAHPNDTSTTASPSPSPPLPAEEPCSPGPAAGRPPTAAPSAGPEAGRSPGHNTIPDPGFSLLNISPDLLGPQKCWATLSYEIPPPASPDGGASSANLRTPFPRVSRSLFSTPTDSCCGCLAPGADPVPVLAGLYSGVSATGHTLNDGWLLGADGIWTQLPLEDAPSYPCPDAPSLYVPGLKSALFLGGAVSHDELQTRTQQSADHSSLQNRLPANFAKLHLLDLDGESRGRWSVRDTQPAGPTRSIPSPRYGHSTCMLDDTQAVVLFGYQYTTPEAAGPATCPTRGGTATGAGAGATATAGSADGGLLHSSPYYYASDVAVLDTATWQWTTAQVAGSGGPESAPKERTASAVASFNNQRVWADIAPAGMTPGESASRPPGGSMAAPPMPGCIGGTVQHASGVVIFGGRASTGAPLNDLWLLDTSTGIDHRQVAGRKAGPSAGAGPPASGSLRASWIRLWSGGNVTSSIEHNAPTPRHSATVFVMPGGCSSCGTACVIPPSAKTDSPVQEYWRQTAGDIYVFGGVDASGCHLSDLYRFSRRTMSWTKLASGIFSQSSMSPISKPSPLSSSPAGDAGRHGRLPALDGTPPALKRRGSTSSAFSSPAFAITRLPSNGLLVIFGVFPTAVVIDPYLVATGSPSLASPRFLSGATAPFNSFVLASRLPIASPSCHSSPLSATFEVLDHPTPLVAAGPSAATAPPTPRADPDSRRSGSSSTPAPADEAIGPTTSAAAEVIRQSQSRSVWKAWGLSSPAPVRSRSTGGLTLSTQATASSSSSSSQGALSDAGTADRPPSMNLHSPRPPGTPSPLQEELLSRVSHLERQLFDVALALGLLPAAATTATGSPSQLPGIGELLEPLITEYSTHDLLGGAHGSQAAPPAGAAPSTASALVAAAQKLVAKAATVEPLQAELDLARSQGAALEQALGQSLPLLKNATATIGAERQARQQAEARLAASEARVQNLEANLDFTLCAWKDQASRTATRVAEMASALDLPCLEPATCHASFADFASALAVQAPPAEAPAVETAPEPQAPVAATVETTGTASAAEAAASADPDAESTPAVDAAPAPGDTAARDTSTGADTASEDPASAREPEAQQPAAADPPADAAPPEDRKEEATPPVDLDDIPPSMRHLFMAPGAGPAAPPAAAAATGEEEMPLPTKRSSSKKSSSSSQSSTKGGGRSRGSSKKSRASVVNHFG